MELNDKEWQIVEPLFPELPTGHRGRPWRGNREVLDGILWILRTGAPWRDLPKKYPSYQTCHRRFQQWCIDGTLKSVLEMIAAKLNKQRKLNLSECCSVLKRSDRPNVVSDKDYEKGTKKNISITMRTGHALSGYQVNATKYYLIVRVCGKVVLVYKHGILEYSISNGTAEIG